MKKSILSIMFLAIGSTVVLAQQTETSNEVRKHEDAVSNDKSLNEPDETKVADEMIEIDSVNSGYESDANSDTITVQEYEQINDDSTDQQAISNNDKKNKRKSKRKK